MNIIEGVMNLNLGEYLSLSTKSYTVFMNPEQK